MKAVKILGRFLAVLLAIVFGIVLLVLMLVTFFKGIVDHNSIDKYIVGSEIVNTKSQEFFQQESSDSKTFEQQICEDLSLIGISNVTIQNALESKEMDKVLSLYVANYVNYILFDEEKPVLSGYLVTSVFKEKLIDSGNVLSTNQEEELTNYIYDITNKINNSVPSISDLASMGYDMNTLRLISGNIFSVSSIIVLSFLIILLYICVALCLWSKLKAVRYISISILVVGFIFVAFCLLEVKILNLFINNQGIVDGLILNIVNKSFQSLLIYGLSLIGVGIALIIISFVMIKNSTKKTKIKMEPIELNKDEKSLIKENLKDHIISSEEDIDKIDDTMEMESIVKEKQDLEDIVDEAKEGVIEGKTLKEDVKKLAIDNVKEIEDVKESNALVIKGNTSNAVMIAEESKIKEEIINDENISEQEYNEKTKVQPGKEIPNVTFVEVIIEDSKTEENGYDYSKDDFDIEIVEVENDIEPIMKEPQLTKNFDGEMEVIEIEKIDDEEITQNVVKDDSKYVEIDDEDEEIVKKEKEVIIPKNVHIDVVSPVKGKTITPLYEEIVDDEEIEIL